MGGQTDRDIIVKRSEIASENRRKNEETSLAGKKKVKRKMKENR